MLVDMHAHVIPGASGSGWRVRGPPRAADRTMRGDEQRGCSRTTAGCSSRRSTRSTRPSAGSRSSSAAASTPRSSRRCRRCSTRVVGPRGARTVAARERVHHVAVRRRPRRLLGWGWCPMQAPELAVAELAQCATPGSSQSRSPRTSSAGRSTARSSTSSGPRRSGSRCRSHPRDAGRLRGTAAAGLIPIAAFAVGADALWRARGSSPVAWPSATRGCGWPSVTAPAAFR